MTELQKMSRRSFLRKGVKSMIGLLGLGSLAAYPFIGERFWYEIREVRLSVKKLPKAFEGWKLVHFSDVHFGFYYGAEQFKRVARIINRIKPDILFFTGDLVHSEESELLSAVPLLKQLKARRGGKWAVLGNHDYTARQQVAKSLQDSQFFVLKNKHGYIDHDGQRLYIAGVNDALYDHVDIKRALQDLSDQDCVMLLAHEPDLADISCTYGISAQFSGHSHGGQIRLPFYGPLFTPDLAKKYIDGLYTVGDNRMPLYVNRGIGCTEMPIRFFCRPEITVFYLHAHNNEEGS